MVNLDLWTYLKSCKKPIVMYGMGNGADKIISYLERYDLSVSDFFASDGFVRGHSFHGKRVLSFSEIKEKYKDFTVLLSFGSSLPDVLSRIYEMSENYEMYAPDVPVAGNCLFNREFYRLHEKEINEVRDLLANENSRRIYDSVISYKLSGDIKYLKNSFDSEEYLYKTLLAPEKYKGYCDLGAYNGDTVKRLLKYGGAPLDIIAIEPDIKNFKKLSVYAESVCGCRIFNAAAWSEDCEISFSTVGNRNSSVAFSGRSVKALALDGIEGAADTDFIKYDVEGSEFEAIMGSRRIIQSKKPDLLVSLYHKSEDVFTLPLLVHRLCPDYKLYITRPEYVPAWDFSLVAKI